MTKKRWILLLKIVGTALVLGFVGKFIFEAWTRVSTEKIVIDWRWGLPAAGTFGLSMLTSAAVWRALAWHLGDRSPTLPLIGAYTYSQMGKYAPGKIFLLLMRVERTGRYGMSGQTCTLATLLENALYMVSGGLVGMTAILRITGEIDDRFRPFIWPVTIAVVIALFAACSPPVFYALVNRILRGMKRPEVPLAERLGVGTLALAVVGFTPCWLFGGMALWAATRAVQPVPLADSWWFGGAFALSVIIGMASFLPGGALIREAVIWAVVTLELSQSMPHDEARRIATVVAILLRVFQLAAELTLGVLGGILTAKRGTSYNEVSISK